MTENEKNNDILLNTEQLEHLKRDMLATVFKETHTQLSLYQHGQRKKSAKKIKTRKLSQNFIKTDVNETMPSEKVLNDIKFDQEIDALKNIFEIALETLKKDNSHEETPYLEVIKSIEDFGLTSNKLELLEQELKENKTALQELKEQQVQQEHINAEQLSKKSQRVQELREQLKNIQCINRLEIKLVEKWEANRLNQAQIIGEKKERFLMQQILDTNRRTSDEQRLICEIQNFRNNEISELKEKIIEWEQKFKREKAKKTAENSQLKQNIADLEKSHEKYRDIMEQRKVFVNEYMKQKAEEQRLYEEQCYRVKCAIRIQAWWRGVMVRRGLGPYRKKSKKGKKSKSKK